jgi:hypothetical protein
MSNLRRVPYTKPIPKDAQYSPAHFARFKNTKGKTVEASLTEDGQRIRLLTPFQAPARKP